MKKVDAVLDYLSVFCDTYRDRVGLIGIYLFYGITPPLILSKNSDINSIIVSLIIILLGMFTMFIYSKRDNPSVSRILDRFFL